MENKKISIPFSEEDLQDLQNGETFDWTFDGVDVHLFMGYDDEDGAVCKKCSNPEKMYWCNDCEANHQEEKCCPACGRACEIDKKYHKDCN